MLKFFAASLLLGVSLAGAAAKDRVHTFKKIQATDQFWAEGADIGDFNHDGKMDVISGPFWYEGPSFQKRHEYRPAVATFKAKKPDGSEQVIPGYEGGLGVANAYSDNFLIYTYDFNGDKWIDVIVYGFPGKEVAWYENPKGASGHWPRHVVFDVLDNESPGFADVTGDGKPEILCCSKGYIAYAEADWSQPTKPWKFVPITPQAGYQMYTHGLGCGDINGDGKTDIIEKDAWWEQPQTLSGSPVWKKHPFTFAPAAAQMLVYDINGDKLADVITAINCHGYGLSWYEQVRDGEKITFREHIILNKNATKNAHGISFTQAHALFAMDMDRDGLTDFVTGKRFWAHGRDGGDPESNEPAVLYWFKLVRPATGQADFIPQLVDDNSGVGTQVTAGFVSNKRYPDIVVGNKKGVFIFKHEVK